MCGIAGFLSPTYKKENLHCITRSIQHRGPDAEGFYFDGNSGIGLGHRRLSILDLSEAANQPFYSKDGRYIMIFNGEVYNFREVAAKYNITPVTTSDSEIIVEAFAKKGIDCVNDFNGMFAIAIWDKQEEKLYLIRDRIGIKPLYYYHDGNEFVFASELKALFLLPLEKKINRNSIADFLYLGYIPGEHTIYEKFRKIPPASYAIVSKSGLSVYPYWKPEEKLRPEVVKDEIIAKSELKSLLESSVKYCMISDVPLGVFLSGGIDSSTVAAIAQAQSSKPVKTFSIGFRETKYNESVFAGNVARHIGSDHHEFTVTEQDAMHLVDKLTDIYDEPYADSSAIPTYMVSQLARKHVTVALSGDGGDELFMGYSAYTWAQRLDNPLVEQLRNPIAKTLHLFGNNRIKRGSKVFNYPTAARKKSHIFSQEQYYFAEREINELLIQPASITIEEELQQTYRKLTSVEEQSFFDLNNYLPEELLVKTDRASMQHALEVRVPLLDYRLVEFAVNLSQQLKIKNNIAKYLLKQVLYDYVPASLFDRPKWGFAVPLRIWLGTELKYLLDKYLSPQVIEECGLVRNKPVQQLKKNFLAGQDYLYNRLWTLIILHKWYKEKHS